MSENYCGNWCNCGEPVIKQDVQIVKTNYTSLFEILNTAEEVLAEDPPHNTRLYKLAKYTFDSLKFLKDQRSVL